MNTERLVDTISFYVTQSTVVGLNGATGRNVVLHAVLVSCHANDIATILYRPTVEDLVKEFTRIESLALLVKFV